MKRNVNRPYIRKRQNRKWINDKSHFNKRKDVWVVFKFVVMIEKITGDIIAIIIIIEDFTQRYPKKNSMHLYTILYY